MIHMNITTKTWSPFWGSSIPKSTRTTLALLCAVGGMLIPCSESNAGEIPKEAYETILRDATAMYSAFQDGDIETYSKYVYPKLLEFFGGATKFVEFLKNGIEEMAAQGVTWESGRASAPDKIFKAGSQLHALFKLDQIMAVPGGKLYVPGHVLGISSDNGKNWTFLDADKLTPEILRKILPKTHPKMKIPPKVDGVFVPD